MQRLTLLLSRLTPHTVIATLTAAVSCAIAFGAPLTSGQSNAILTLGGSLSVILFAHGLSRALTFLSPQSVIGLVTAAIGVACAFGLPVTPGQTQSILTLTALFAGLLLVHGVVHTAVRDRRVPQPVEPVAPSVPAAAKIANAVIRSTVGVPAVGIHAHPRYKTGLKTPSNKRALLASSFLTGVLPKVPVAADHLGKLTFGLYANDRFGVCGPTSVANLARLVSGGLLGTEIQPSQEDVFRLYRLSGNPNFNPNDPNTEDNGVDMQTMLEALLQHGIGDGKGGVIKPLAFAKLDTANEAELTAAVSIFGGALWGVLLENAQKAQTDRRLWSFRKSAVWGGHAVMNGAYEARAHEDVITWAERVATTRGFRKHQLQQAFLVVWPWNIEHPAFQAGVDLAKLKGAYKALTGRELAA